MGIKTIVKRMLAAVMYQYYKRTPKRPRVMSIDETLDLLLNTKKSLVRFGDGEILQVNGKETPFQKPEQNICGELSNVLTSEYENLIVAVPNVFDGLDEYIVSTRLHWKEHLLFFGKTYLKHCKREILYGNAFISRCYMILLEKEKSVNYFAKFRAVFKDKDLLVVEGENTHNGVGNDLFSEANSVKRIIGPGKNAYEKRANIITACCEFPRDTLILISLGITAKGIAYELFQKGYRVLDIGNLDMEYEWFMMKTNQKVEIEKHQVIGMEANREAGYDKYLSEVICWLK